MSMIDVVEYFGLQERVYRMHCPMAFDDEGASWLSNRDEILNPYFGDAMLACGVIETYRQGYYRQGARVNLELPFFLRKQKMRPTDFLHQKVASLISPFLNDINLIFLTEIPGRRKEEKKKKKFIT
jgi:hypothetical protein